MRSEHALQLAKAVGWHAHTIHTSQFTFKTYMPSKIKPGGTLRIYIEGDGFSWRDSETPSDNPTPMNPMALQLAIEDRGYQRVVYLARPCQYVFGDDWGSCQEAYWTQLRFSPEVIEASHQAISELKKRWGAKKITLIGYSGGGAISLLVAERRSDIESLITVAGVLDTKTWVDELGLQPLYGSLNPADKWVKLGKIPQIHYVGQDDTVMPKEVANAYIKRFPPENRPKLRVVPNFNHDCCWARDWLKLMGSDVLHSGNI